MKLESKYNIGDTVYGAGYKTVTEYDACYDCLGTKQWDAVLPTGEVLKVDCPTCHTAYYSSGILPRSEVKPVVTQLTVGRVTYESNYDGGKDTLVFKYTCDETGIGSGTVYPEHDLYPDHDSAMPYAKNKAFVVAENNKRVNDEQTAKRKKQLRKVSCTYCDGSGHRKTP